MFVLFFCLSHFSLLQHIHYRMSSKMLREAFNLTEQEAKLVATALNNMDETLPIFALPPAYYIMMCQVMLLCMRKESVKSDLVKVLGIGFPMYVQLQVQTPDRYITTKEILYYECVLGAWNKPIPDMLASYEMEEGETEQSYIMKGEIMKKAYEFNKILEKAEYVLVLQRPNTKLLKLVFVPYGKDAITRRGRQIDITLP